MVANITFDSSVLRSHLRRVCNLHERSWAQGQSACIEEAMGLCRTWDRELSVERTSKPWVTQR